ncbi:MAG: TIGR04086 family membrane protein [Firmicutes bacterium]|nr:TIGR04086 family membrane protein [Bacillota bacterium]
MKEHKNSKIRQILKGTLYGLVTTMVLILFFAIFVRFAGIGSTTIGIITQVIKVISIFIAVRIALREIKKRGYLFGGIIGIVYTVLTFFIFSIITTEFSITTGILFEFLFAITIGAASALLLKMGRREA